VNARGLHFDAVVVDCHADTIQRALDDGADLTVRSDEGHVDLPRLREGGVDAQFFACFAAPEYVERNGCVKRILQMIDAVKDLERRAPDRVAIARTAADVRRLAAEKRTAAVLCVEGGHAIEDDLGVLRQFHELGVRYMTLTWNNTNGWADGCGGPERHGGLTGFGRDVVREMNRIGMMVDLSHAAEETFRDAVKTSTKPVLLSHANARALCDHRRNLTDDQLRAVAESGGVVAVVFYSGFVSGEFRKAVAGIVDEWDRKADEVRKKHGGDTEAMDRELDAIRAEYRKRIVGLPRPAMEDLLKQVDHIVKIAGIDHVGVGSDYDGCSNVPRGLGDCSKMPALTEALIARGYPEDDVRKILGGNVLRVMKEAVDDVTG
jgi:membrane dipeptidase